MSSKGIAKAVEFMKEMLGKEGSVVKADKTDKESAFRNRCMTRMSTG